MTYSPRKAEVRFARFAWATLVFNFFVILWGAFVRATGSGAGCGKHWPQCDGQWIGPAQSVEQLIEFTHRATAGVALILTVILVIGACRLFDRGHRVRKAAWTTLAFMIAEALLGAGLVLFGLVEDDDSVARAVVIAAHLLNTLALLGFMALTAWWATRPGQLNLTQPAKKAFTLAIAGLFLVGITGAIAALGDTLFPEADHLDNLKPGAHFLLQLRMAHPIVALVVGCGIGMLANNYRSHFLGKCVLTLVVLQIILGFVNMALYAPIPLQLTHLLLADLVWVSLILLGAEVLEKTPASTE